FCFGITTFPVFCSSFFLNSYLSFPIPINSPLGTFTVFVSYLAPNLLISAFFDLSPANATTSLFVRSNSLFLSSNSPRIIYLSLVLSYLFCGFHPNGADNFLPLFFTHFSPFDNFCFGFCLLKFYYFLLLVIPDCFCVK